MKPDEEEKEEEEQEKLKDGEKEKKKKRIRENSGERAKRLLAAGFTWSKLIVRIGDD